MLTRGNRKLIGSQIWTFSLPSGLDTTCPGRTPICEKHCYDKRADKVRPNKRRRREANYRASRKASFVPLILGLIDYHDVQLMRLHVGGDFGTYLYTRKWLKIMKEAVHTRFWFYTRSWRVESIRPVIEQMSTLSNVRVWYSLDKDTGLPEHVPENVRCCWMMTEESDLPPPGEADLIFRIQKLRKKPLLRIRPKEDNVRICPDEDGMKRKKKVGCGPCNICFRPLQPENKTPTELQFGPGRVSLPLCEPGEMVA